MAPGRFCVIIFNINKTRKIDTLEYAQKMRNVSGSISVLLIPLKLDFLDFLKNKKLFHRQVAVEVKWGQISP